MENTVDTKRFLCILQHDPREELMMKKRLLSLLLVCVLLAGLIPALPVQAATQSPNSPYAMIEYGYSSTVTCGTVRYISQVSSDSYFYSSYWPSSNFGYYVGAQVECGTASMSMALSYIGVNKTPKAILEANNGATVFNYGWGGSTYKSVGASSLSTAVSNYINGGGKYSPPVIHIPGYSAAGHYVVVVGQISSGKYQILDPWQRALTTMTVSGSSATYTTYTTFYDTIDQIHQWYKADASINNDVTVTFNANGGSCSTTSREVAAGSKIGTLPTPTRSGYTFVGWYPSKDGGKAPITASTTVSKAVTYYAQWTSKRTAGNKITFNTAGGTLPGTLATYTLSGTNTARGTDQLILFNCDGQKVKTSIYGAEVAVDANGQVIEKRPYRTPEQLTVPEGGFILSGFGKNDGMCKKIEAIHVGQYVSYDSDAGTVTVFEDLNAYLSTRKTVASGSTYGDLPVPTLGDTPFLGWYTAATGGTKITADSTYSNAKLYAHWGCNHSYTSKQLTTTCGDYQKVKYTCSVCGSSYTAYADDICSKWTTTKPTDGLYEKKTQYAYADYETIYSAFTSETGYTQLGSEWKYQSSTNVNYVDSWPPGFDTSSSMYTKYNNKSKKYGPSESAATKVTILDDKQVGYLYYHWCDTSKTSCMGYQTGVYNTFHAYYDTTDPSNYDCDTSDYSYKTSNSACSNSNWWLAVEVHQQSVAMFGKEFRYGRWKDWSSWSDQHYAAGVNRKVKSRTVYRTVTGEPQNHLFANAICIHCGTACTHSWSGGKCTVCGFSCSHRYDRNGKCTVCGFRCSHQWKDGVCTQCSMVCSHNYSGGKCTVCGFAEPNQDLYLFGYINGEAYGCDSDFNNLGTYRFQNGKLVATFTKDSHVGIKTADNLIWYMTAGYLGTNVTSGTLYPSSEITDADLLYVPGGVEITFTLKKNTNGTLTLSYELGERPVTLKPKSPALSFEDEVYINVFFTAENLGTLGPEDMGLITWSIAREDGTVDDAEHNIPGATYDAASGRYIVRSAGIRPAQLSDTLYFKIYIRLTDGSYLYSKLLNYSPKTYAVNMLNSSTSSAKLKSLIVAMLNYGAAAQTYFSYKPYNLMNSSLTAAQKAMVQSYSASMVSTLAKPDTAKAGVFTNNGGYSKRTPAVSFEGAFCINYFFTPSNSTSAMKLYYWTQEDYNAVTKLTTGNATGTIKMTKEDGVFTAAIDQIPAKELNSGIYVAARYSSGGVIYCTGVLPYSIGTYCTSMATKEGNVAALAQATAVYGYYAKAYFG